MNSLGRTIRSGEVVIIDCKYLDPSLQDRRFRCESGFGMSHITVGSALFGAWLVDGERCRINAMMIDKVATVKYQEVMSNEA